MSVQLLDKTRKINRLLHNKQFSRIVFHDICQVLTEVLNANILIMDKDGKILAASKSKSVERLKEMFVDQVGECIDPVLNDRILGILSTKENVNLETLGFEDKTRKFHTIITPIAIAGDRIGTLFEYRLDVEFSIDDIILTEYAATVVGLEIMRSIHEEKSEELRKIQVIKSAVSTLSATEREAIIHIFDELNGPEGILVASKIADKVGITRSVIVNALRKFESAGILDCRSSGMRGTYIRVVDSNVFDEIAKMKAEEYE